MKRVELLLIPVIAGMALSAYANSASLHSSQRTRPNVHQFDIRLRIQFRLVQKGLKTGKLTQEQADTLKSSLRSARQQENEMLQQDGHRDLTKDQMTQLNTLLDKNSRSIGEGVSKN
ncbi:MAG TPA: hypothetical protein VHE12_00065 [bacterium]|nr:hypothetical protein [bacterium]